MDRIINKLKQLGRSTLFYFIIATLLILIAVWLLGPELNFSGHHPLASWQSRLMQTAVIAICWLNFLIIKLILREKQFPRPPRSSSVEREAALEQTVLTDIKRDCQQVIHACKKARPWFLLIGPQSSGKTSLLSQLPFKVKSLQQNTLIQAKTTQWIDWWISEQAVFIDPAGKYALAQPDEPSEQIVWRGLIHVLKKNRRRAPLRGILVIIDITTLCQTNNPTFNDLIESFIYQLQILKSLQQSLTVTTIITQSDRVIGFNEFFDDLSKQERRQAFGFNVMSSLGDLAAQVENKFEAFIKNLSARSLWRLHHEHSLHKRCHIQEFPLQMEKLGQRLKTLTTQLPWSSYLQLHGIYFISSLQHQAPIDLLQTGPSNQTFGLQVYQQTTVHHEQHKYFIDQLIHNVITHAHNNLNQPIPANRKQLLAYPAAIVLIGSLTLIWHHSYQRNVNVINNIVTTLNTSATYMPKDLALPWLNQLNTLAQTLTSIEQKHNHLDQLTGLNQSQQLIQSTQSHYQKLLQSNFMPYLIDSISSVIEQNKYRNPIALYNGLKIYLMLTKHQHVDTSFIRIWFDQYWQQAFPDDVTIQSELQQHLNQLLQLPPIEASPNEMLIDQAQNELRQLPFANRAFLKLQNSYSLNQIPILAELPKIDNIDLSQATVCSFCTTSHFQEVYSQQIPKIASSMNQGDWVLATGSGHPLSSHEQAVLTKNLRGLFLDYYKQQWAEALPKIRLIPAQTLSQAQNNIELLKNPTSQFWKILHIVYDNITLNQFKLYEDESASPAVAALETFLKTDSELTQQTSYNLNQLQDYLFHINEITEVDKASYDAAVKRFQTNGENDPINALLQQAQQAPALVQPWLQVVAQGTWHAILANAHQYLNTIWSTTVTPEYEQHIDHLYPIFRDADDNITLPNFTHFFGPNGTIGNFFNEYLQPFVNMQDNYWTFKTLDGESLSISQHALEMLIRASMIQQMFFTDNHDQPLVNFDLLPIKLGDETNAFTISLGSQVLQFSQDQHNDQTLYWPPPDAQFASILFNGADSQGPNLTISGPWALFKLLDQAQVNSTKNAREYQVKFALQHYSAQYVLVATHLVNPFIPGILNKFRCPTQL